jgi:hypothetical protein
MTQARRRAVEPDPDEALETGAASTAGQHSSAWDNSILVRALLTVAASAAWWAGVGFGIIQVDLISAPRGLPIALLILMVGPAWLTERLWTGPGKRVAAVVLMLVSAAASVVVGIEVSNRAPATAAEISSVMKQVGGPPGSRLLREIVTGPTCLPPDGEKAPIPERGQPGRDSVSPTPSTPCPLVRQVWAGTGDGNQVGAGFERAYSRAGFWPADTPAGAGWSGERTLVVIEADTVIPAAQRAILKQEIKEGESLVVLSGWPQEKPRATPTEPPAKPSK